MTRRVQKWGNSLAVRIPQSFAVETGIKEDSQIDVTLSEGRIVISPVKRRKYTLDELLAGVTEENRHPEFDTGPPVGEELI